MIHQRTDPEWVRQVKADDEQTVTDLWQQLFVWALTLARRYGQEEDLGRNAAVAAYWRIRRRGVHQYRFQGPFLGFCRRILVNEVHRRIQQTPAVVDIDSPEVVHPSSHNPAPTADGATVQRRLQPCLDQLKAREREVISLLYLKEMEPQIAADQMGISRNNANVIAFRARQKLRNCLEQRGYADSADVLSV